jgi:hypothetical protein
MLRRLFAQHNNISKRIIPICTNLFKTDNAIVAKQKSSIFSNISIFSNHFSAYIGNNNVTLSNCTQFNFLCFDDVVWLTISYYISCFYTHFSLHILLYSICCFFKKICKLIKKILQQQHFYKKYCEAKYFYKE